jgi:hypothetical protein
VEYACEGQGDTMCVFVTGSNLEKAKTKTAEVVGVFEAEDMKVCRCAAEPADPLVL